MIDSSQTALDLLQQLRAEREELDVLIRGLEKRMGIISERAENEVAQANGPRVSLSLDSIPVGFFHNLSQPAATEKLLRLNPLHPLTTTEILEAFRKSGIDVSSKNSVTILYTSLKRSPKFERVAGKAWGLAEWYPEKRKRKDGQEGAVIEGGNESQAIPR